MSNVCCCYCVSRILPVVCRWERFLLNRQEWRCVNSGFVFSFILVVLNSQILIIFFLSLCFDANVQVPMGLERWILRPVRPLSWLQTRLLQRQPVAVHLRDQLGWHPLQWRYFLFDSIIYNPHIKSIFFVIPNSFDKCHDNERALTDDSNNSKSRNESRIYTRCVTQLK
jgi:hypothetical protein